MAEEEFHGRRKSVKRIGKRITLDMRKELDSMFIESDDGNEIGESDEKIKDEDSCSNDIQRNPTSNNASTKQDNHDGASTNSTTSDNITTSSPSPSPSLHPTRTLTYSNSLSKIIIPPRVNTDGNGRSSTIPSNSNDGAIQNKNGIDQPNVESISQEDPSTQQEPSINITSNVTNTTPPTLSISIPNSNASNNSNNSNSPVLSSPTWTGDAKDLRGRRSLFFDNAASKVVRVVIIATDTVAGPPPYTVYVMEVSSEGGQVVQTVTKRFKNYCELVDKLKERAPELAGMLPARMVLGNMAAKLVSHRKAQLQELLDYILNHKDLSRSVEVHAFFRNPTLLAQLASKPDMQGHLHKGFVGALGIKYIQMWALLKSPCLYFCQSQSDTAEIKSSVILRWLTVEIIDEITFTFELRPWQHSLSPSDPQSRPISMRASSRDEMLDWARAIHRVKATVNDIIMLKKTMLLEEDLTSEVDLGDEEDDLVSPRPSPPLTSINKIPPLSLSLSSDTINKSTSETPSEPRVPSSSPSPRLDSKPRTGALLQRLDLNEIPSSPSPSSPRTLSLDPLHRARNQTQPPSSPPVKIVARSQTESHLSLARAKLPSETSSPNLSTNLPPILSPNIRNSTPVAKLKEYVEKTDSQPLSRFEARMALIKEPPKYLHLSVFFFYLLFF